MKPIIKFTNSHAITPFDKFLKSFFSDDQEFFKDKSFFNPAINVVDEGNEYIIEVQAPGLKKEDFQINIENNRLHISYARKQEKEEKSKNYIRRDFHIDSFEKSFDLSEEINVDSIEAKYNEGILKLHLKKKAETPAQKKVVQVA